ncbi:MAG: M48 family metallopeptidase [Agarilytica sp.]
MNEQTHRYDCHGVHTSLPKGKASGELIVSPSHLSLKIQDKHIQIGFDQLELKLGGASDRLVFITHPSKPDWQFYTSDRSLLKDSILNQHTHLSAKMTKARGTRQLNWALLLVVIIAIIATPVFLLSNMDVASKIVAEQIPVEWETKLGKTGFDQYTLQQEFMEDKQAEALLNPLVQPLLDVLPEKRFDYQFYISADEQLNAFALPGGIVVINAGLILAANSPEEVLGVVAHEIIHVRQRHGIRNVISSAGTYLLISALVGDVSGVFAILVDAAPLLINQGYSRKFESEADALGFDILVKANIDPTGLARFFEKIIAKEQEMYDQIEDEEQREWLKEGMSFLSSHPATEDRIAALHNRAKDFEYNYLDLDNDFSKLKESVSIFVVEHTKALEKDENKEEAEASVIESKTEAQLDTGAEK